MWVGIQCKFYTSWYRYEVYKWQNSFQIFRDLDSLNLNCKSWLCDMWFKKKYWYTPCCRSALKWWLIIQCIGLHECVSVCAQNCWLAHHPAVPANTTAPLRGRTEWSSGAAEYALPTYTPRIHSLSLSLAVSQWVHVICLRHHSFFLPLFFPHCQPLPHSFSLSFLFNSSPLFHFLGSFSLFLRLIKEAPIPNSSKN